MSDKQMCGFLFQYNEKDKIDLKIFQNQINHLKWRGPDNQTILFLRNNYVGMLHCRLSIIDLNPRANQPMISKNQRYVILFNGEIYNHLEIRDKLKLNCQTSSDTETILEGYAKFGKKIFNLLDGMFSIVIYDNLNNNWIAVRDAFGIKPMYIYQSYSKTIICSETHVINNLVNSDICKYSLKEFKLLRRPIPGRTIYKNINEVLPGTVLTSSNRSYKIWDWSKKNDCFNQNHLEDLIKKSIQKHLISDVKVVSLLSGGIDSSIITSISKINKCYSVGLLQNNEFKEASQIADALNVKLKKIKVSKNKLINSWKFLINIRNEPINLPNEGLIYNVFKSFNNDEKVALTGEGADEIFFGYDNIFRLATKKVSINSLLKYYFYDNSKVGERLNDFVTDLAKNKTPIEFLEDFFYQHHLPTLLRRMDFASMASSKEARVPFVNKSIISYLYRMPSLLKIDEVSAKKPLRQIINKIGLSFILNTKKIGFSSKLNSNDDKILEYNRFYSYQFKVLGWEV